MIAAILEVNSRMLYQNPLRIASQTQQLVTCFMSYNSIEFRIKTASERRLSKPRHWLVSQILFFVICRMYLWYRIN
jgi:hypothetical protein